MSYVGFQRYFLTMCTANRCRWFTEPKAVDLGRSLLLQTAARYAFAVPAYCFMPDHLHVLAEGTTIEADLPRFVSAFKQQTGFQFTRQCSARLWQDGYYDRVLRSDEETLDVVKYILENPVRAGLVALFDRHPYSGSDRYSVSEVAQAVSQHQPQG